MRYEYLHETLVRMFPDVNPDTSWTLFYDPAISDEIVIQAWNLQIPQPLPAEIDAVYATIVMEKEREQNCLCEETIRNERDRRFRVIYDPSISQLFRKRRLTTDSAELDSITAQITQWDSYANQLENIPQQPGFPWNGNIDLVPWPIPPEKQIE